MPRAPSSPNDPHPKARSPKHGSSRPKINLSVPVLTPMKKGKGKIKPDESSSPRKAKKSKRRHKEDRGDAVLERPKPKGIIDLTSDTSEPEAGPSRPRSRPKSSPQCVPTPLRSLIGSLHQDTDEEAVLNSSYPPQSTSGGISKRYALPAQPIGGVQRQFDSPIFLDLGPNSPTRPPADGSSSAKADDHFKPPPLFSHDLSRDRPPESSLLLPNHITLDASDTMNQARDSVKMEGVHFIDDEIAQGVSRYFDDTVEESEEASFLASADGRKTCTNCKQLGHKMKDCPHIIVRDHR